MSEQEDQIVVVISPIGDEGTPTRKRADAIADYIVAPVAKEVNLRVVRSDREPEPGPITPRILRSILAARVVVADLTDQNPNVFYELCFAHAFGRPVVIVVDSPSNLPFDVKDERVISLGDEGRIEIEQGERAKDKIREAFEVVLKEGYIPNSVITEVASVQNIETMTPKDPVASELAAIKRRVDQIHANQTPQSKSEGTRFRQADIVSAMALIDSLAEQELVSVQEAKNLITEKTSDPFDDWAEGVRKKIEGDLPEKKFEDLPF